jgi:mannose-6-phosphate isomerase-like protein (cupin superfamily)
MERGPIVSREVDQEWETWSEEEIPQKGLVFWKTLISKGITRSENLTLGIANLPPGGALREHRHTQEEVYLVLEGSGLVRVGDEELVIEYRATPYTPARTPVRRTCGWPTSFRRTPSRRSSTSSRAERVDAIISPRSRG